MHRSKHYRRLPGSSAYYPYGARRALRHSRKRKALLLRLAGVALLCLAAALAVRQSFFHGGQPAPPAVAFSATAETAPTATPVRPVTVAVKTATADALAATDTADAAARSSPAPQTPAQSTTVAEILPQYRALYEQNPDMVGWLRVDGTDIDYPVLQTPGNNEYYLRRGFDRLYATAGSLFLDERCQISAPATANWLVYGHNMADGSMFGTLARYADEAFYAAHPTLTFDTLTKAAQWQVFAVLRTELGADALPYYSFFDAADEADWQRRVDAITALALYDTGVTPQPGQQLLTLSTCGSTAPGTTARLAVVAVKIEQ